MIQSSFNDKICNLHKQKIISFCLYPTCDRNRLVCQECFAIHLHCEINQCKNAQEILYQTSQASQNLISKLSRKIDQTLIYFQRLKKGIDDKYNLTIDRVNLITNDQLNQFVQNIIQFDQHIEIITTIMENACSEFDKNINLLVIELQLEKLNYLEISKDDQIKAQQLFNEGYTLYREKKDYNGAIKLFDQALIYNPNQKHSLLRKGQSLYAVGRYKESIEHYDKVLAINSNHIKSISGKGDSLRKLSQYKESIELYDKALAIDSMHGSSIYGKACSLRKLGQYQEAVEWYNKALSIHPNHVELLKGKGDSLRLQKNYPEALSILDQALMINPNHSRTLGLKGACLNSQENYQEALVFLEQSCQLNPKKKFNKTQLKICQEKLKGAGH